MKKCPFCAEEIQSEAIKCRYCGERLESKPTNGDSEEQVKSQEKLYGQPHEAPKEEPPPVSSSRQSSVAAPPGEKNQKPHKSFSWKYFILAVVIAVFINIFASAAAGTKPAKNIMWTVWWIYLTIEAWKYWKWKALLPYPIFLLTSIPTAMIMASAGVDYKGWTDLIVRATLNIGGLIIFYTLFRKSKKAHEMNYPAASLRELETKGLLKGLSVFVFLVCIILLVVTLAGKKNDSEPEKSKDPFGGYFDKTSKVEAPVRIEPPAPAPRSPDAPAPISTTAEYWYDKAFTMCRSGECTDPQKAIEYTNEAILLRPDYADAYSQRGSIYFRMYRYQQAISDYNEAIRLKPGDSFNYSLLGLTYLVSGNREMGCRSLMRACEMGNCNLYENAKQKGNCR